MFEIRNFFVVTKKFLKAKFDCTPLHWHFLPYNGWQRVKVFEHLPPPLVNVVCERPLKWPVKIWGGGDDCVRRPCSLTQSIVNLSKLHLDWRPWENHAQSVHLLIFCTMQNIVCTTYCMAHALTRPVFPSASIMGWKFKFSLFFSL